MSEPLPGEVLLSAQRLEPMAKMPAGHEEPAAQDVSELDAGELTEARRIAGELVRLHRDGAIRSQKDASFYAHLLRDFGATYTGPVSNNDGMIRRAPYLPTKQQRVRVPRGLTMEERVQKDLDDMAGLKDTKQGRNRCRIWI